VVRIENVEHPEQYVAAAMDRCQKKHLERTYEVTNWNNATEFLEALARKGGRLLKGGEADLDGVAKMFLNDLYANFFLVHRQHANDLPSV